MGLINHAYNPASSQPNVESKKPDSVLFSQASYLELEALYNERNPLRGFITLFWVVMAFFFLQNILNSIRDTGSLIGQLTFEMMRKHITELIVADILMLLSASLAFPLQLVISIGVIASQKLQYWVQATFQLLFLAFWSVWIYNRDWYIIQRATLILHTIVSLMKMHSYNSVNQHCFYNYQIYQRAIAKTPNRNLEPTEEGILKAAFSGAAHKVVYPQNVGLSNYLDFLLVPSLIYQLEYPRLERFRPSYFIGKVLALVGTIGLIYIAIEHHLFPLFLSNNALTSPELIIKLAIPFTVVHLLLFYILFEVVCNAFAELTRFADRNFYDDWWNSHNFLEYSSKWNKPVYRFLKEHVFKPFLMRFGFSQRVALILTFLVSSLFHELVMVVTFRKFIFALFLLQMFQIPLIDGMQRRFIVVRPWLGNAIVWVGLCSGIPMLSLLYLTC